MAENTQKMNILGSDLNVIDVPIRKSNERFSYYELSDGHTIKVKHVATRIVKFQGQTNPIDGSPIYLILATSVASTVSPSEEPEK